MRAKPALQGPSINMLGLSNMLSFTLDRGGYTGLYNGRFVFHAPDEAESSSDNYLRMIAEGHSGALIKDVFRHEYYHWVTFRSSIFGISTVGRRYRARSEFLRGNEAAVRNYYKQRTAYFCCSYQTHENIVEQLEQSNSNADIRILQKSKLSRLQKRCIRKADRQSKEATEDLNVIESKMRIFLDFVNGLRASLEFGLQVHVRDSEGRVRGREVSLKSSTLGIFNAAFEDEFGPNSFIVRYLKRVRRSRNRERRMGGLDKRKMARWAAIKFVTESEALRQLKELGYPTPFSFDKYCGDISRFAHRHTLNSDRIMEKHLASIIDSCGHYNGSLEMFEELIDMFENVDQPILYFFYVHGN